MSHMPQVGCDHGDVVSERINTPLCRVSQGPISLFVPMTGRVELPYEPPDHPDLDDPEVRERLRAEAYEEAKKELRRRMLR